MKVITGEQMRKLDAAAIASGVPSLNLMDNAAKGVAHEMRRVAGSVAGRSIAVVCGPGNNGGDGLALARFLLDEGAMVFTLLVAGPDKLSPDAKVQYQRLKEKNGSIRLIGEIDPAEVLGGAEMIVDAIFGTGFRRQIGGPAHDLIATLNATVSKTGAFVVSIDTPSGLLADTGQPLGEAVRASMTVTLGLPKLGLLLPPGSEHTGVLKIADIGIPPAEIAKVATPYYLTEPSDFSSHLASRPLNSHKGHYGHSLLVGGSRDMPGSVLLAGKAALRTGGALVTICLPQAAYKKLQPGFLELMYAPLPNDPSGCFSVTAAARLTKAIQGKAAVGVGPGMGKGRGGVKVVEWLCAKAECPLVIDADGLSGLAGRLERLKKKFRPARVLTPWVLTPHPGEAARLLRTSAAAIQKDRLGSVRAMAEASGATVVLKGYRSVIALPDGGIFFNPTGNPGMATAGSGDVLTGMMTALAGRHEDMKLAVIAAVYLHGLAGDLAARAQGEEGLIASDIIEKIPAALKSL